MPAIPNPLLNRDPCEKCGQPHVNTAGTPTCRAHKKNTDPLEPCLNYARKGQKVCSYHGGAVKAAVAKGKERQLEMRAEIALGKLRGAITRAPSINPRDALQQEVDRTNAIVHWLGEKVAQLDDGIPTDDDASGVTVAAGGAHTAGKPHPLVWGVTQEQEVEASEYPGTNTTHSAEMNIWYVMWKKEREHLVVVTTAALKAGIDQRRIELSERIGQQVANTLRAILNDLVLSPEQEAMLPTVVPRHFEKLRVIEQNAGAA